MRALFKKTGFKICAAIFAVFAILIIAVWLKFQLISEKVLQLAGYPDAVIGDARFTPAGSFFENIKLTVGDVPVTIARVEAYATIADALEGRLTKVVIDDVMIGLPSSNDTEKEAAHKDVIIALPVPLDLHAREIVFRNIRAFIPFAEGAPALFSGSLVDRGAEYQLSGEYHITGDSLRAQGQLSLKAGKDTGTLSGQIDLADAHLDMPDAHIALRRGAGWITLEATPDALAGKTWPVINAQLSAGSLKLYALPLQGLTLTAAIKPEKSEILLQGQGMDDSGEILAEVRLDRTDSASDSLKLLLDTKLKNLDALGVKDLKGRGQAKLDVSAQKPRGDGWLSWQNVGGGLDISAQKLSLPGLMRDVEAAASFVISHNLADSTTILTAADKALDVKGVILPVDAQKPVSLHLPANAKTPPKISWNAAVRQLQVGFQGLDVTTPVVAAKDFSLALSAGFNGKYPKLSGTLSAAELSHTAKPPAFVPVRLNGVIRSDSAKPQSSLFNIDLSEKNGLLGVHINGLHDFAENKGALDLSMPQTTMRTGVYSLKDIFPLSAAYVQDVTGTLGMTAGLKWQKAKSGWKTESAGELFMRGLTGNVDGNIISNVSGVIKFDSLMPFTLTRQSLAVGSVNVGLPLGAGIVVASLDAQNNFTLHSAEWILASGKIVSDPFTLNLGAMTAENVMLKADGLQLAELFKIAPMDGLTAEGAVGGTLPLHIRAGEVTLENGVLESRGSGFIRYNPQDMPAFLRDSSQKQMVDLQVALRAFEFETLKLTLDGTLGKDQKIGLSVKGKNPEFYNGYPVSLNLNVEGPLENILKYSPGSSQIPDSIRKQLEEYEKNNAKE